MQTANHLLRKFRSLHESSHRKFCVVSTQKQVQSCYLRGVCKLLHQLVVGKLCNVALCSHGWAVAKRSPRSVLVQVHNQLPSAAGAEANLLFVCLMIA